MAEIKEVIDDVKKGLGDRGFIFLLLGIGAVFVFMLLRDNNGDSSTYIVPTGYTSYPDAVTNADVIIDEVNKNTDYNTQTIMDSLEGINTGMNDSFSITNDFIQEGLDSITSGMETTNGLISDGFTNVNEKLDGISTDIGGIQSGVSNIQSGVSNIQSGVSGIKSSVSGMNSTLSTIQSGISKNQQAISNLQKVQTAANSASNTTVAKSASSSYYQKTSYNGVSLVDGLKSIGVYTINGKKVDDVSSRTALAKANGISNYTGTASQNKKLLDMLKSGTLKKG